MKSITSIFVVLILMLVSIQMASADFKSATVFNNLSTNGGTVKGTPIDVRGSSLKTVQVTGVNMSTLAATTLAGTFLLECGPTSSGPWVTCKDQGANATTTTSNASFDMISATQWVRGSWAKTTGRVKAWLTY